MKKYLLALICFAFMFVLCSCGEPIDCSICEMNFQLPNDYTVESDRETANSNLNDALEAGEENKVDIDLPEQEITLPDGTTTTIGGNDSDDEEESLKAEDYLDVKWYYGGESDIVVTAMYSPHNNDDLGGAIEGAGGYYTSDKDDEYYTFFDLGEGKGRRGEEGANYDYMILHNGILYDVTIFNTSQDDFTETDISDFINSISFDNKALKSQNVECGDISLKLSGEYQPLTIEEKEGWEDQKAYGKFGKTRTDFSINYFDSANYKSPSEIAEYMKSTLSDADYSEIKEDFGKCYYLSGHYEGQDEVMAFFEKNEKIYMLDLLSEDGDLSIEDLQKITKTIKTE